MLNLILRALSATGGIAPGVFGDEFFGRTGSDEYRRAACGRGNKFLASVPSPRITAPQPISLALDRVRHGIGDIRLAVEVLGESGDGAPRDNLPHEYDATAPALCRSMPDIETQIDLLEITMEREGNSKNAGAQKEEAHDADVGGAVELIQFQTRRDQGLEQGALDRIVKHHKMPPFGS
jgi:hypothetical protein